MEMEYAYPDHLTKAQALARRADKLHSWLQRDEYAVYRDENSIDNLLELIDLIIYALEYGLPDPEWQRFRRSFKLCHRKIREEFETPEELVQTYNAVIVELKITLEDYILAEQLAT